MEQNNYLENFVFYLNLSEKLPSVFFEMSALLSQYKISLIPVTPLELSKLVLPGKNILLALVPDLASCFRMIEYRKSFLNYAILAKRFHVIEATSFADINLVNKYRLTKCLTQIRLPAEIEEVIHQVAESYFSEKRDSTKWPGGRRGKIPEPSKARAGNKL